MFKSLDENDNERIKAYWPKKKKKINQSMKTYQGIGCDFVDS